MNTFLRLFFVAIAGSSLLATPPSSAQPAELLPASSARLVYVAPTGSDAASGLAPDQAVADPVRGLELLRAGSGDWLLLQRGSDYELASAVSPPQGLSAATPAVIAAWGEGATPTLDVGPNATGFSPSALSARYTQVRGVVLEGIADFPVLQPGSGWTGPTPQPATVGSPGAFGYDAKVIARWDVVPYQTFDGVFHIGVVAFHINGIDRIEFSVDNGPWVAVNEMKLNPRTNVWEYTAALDPAVLSDGSVEVRAVVYPRGAGEPRVLADGADRDLGESSVRLFANSNGTLPNTGLEVYVAPGGNDNTGDGSRANPYGTIGKAIYSVVVANGTAEGAAICLLPGTYTYPDLGGTNGASDRWLTLQAAPGIDRSRVILTSPGVGASQKKLHVKNVTLQLGANGPVLTVRSDPYYNHFWIDGCEIVGRGHISSDSRGVVSGGNRPTFYTDCVIRDIVSSGIGNQVVLTRNVSARNLGGDFINSPRLTLNGTVTHMRHASGVHPDVVQIAPASVDNMIVYGIRATDVNAQGLNIGDHGIRNVAAVNILIEQIPHDPQYSWTGGGAGADNDHLLFWHISFVDIDWRFTIPGITNMSIRNCVMSSISLAVNGVDGSTFPGLDARDNHFLSGPGFGTQATFGDPAWTDAVAGNYRPASDSPLRARINDMLVPSDASGQARTTPAAIGAYE